MPSPLPPRREKGTYAGQTVGIGAFPYDTTGKAYSLTMTLNGTTSGSITISTNVIYQTGSDLAAAIQTAINADSVYSAADLAVTVNYDTDHFDITSTKYGSSSNASITVSSAEAISELGLTVVNGTAGRDVAGTTGGVPGFALGNVLLPKLGEDAEGLTLVVGENATSGSVSFSRGFSGGSMNWSMITCLQQALSWAEKQH
jgi:flagellar hook-associated protein 2